MQIYITFPDGVYHYVCRECTLLCCHRSEQFGGDLNRELRSLIKLYPGLESVAISRRGTIVNFATPSGRCYFLGDDNLCGVETAHGKELKPSGCRLFPFNNFTRIGKTVVVSPNFLCVLRLEMPARPGEVEGTHATIEAAVRESSYLMDANYDSLAKHALPSSMDAAATLIRESSFRDACAQAYGRISFLELLHAQSSDPAQLDEWIDRAARIIGLELSIVPHNPDRIDHLMLALAPTLRLGMLHFEAENLLLALALGELILRRILTVAQQFQNSAGVADVTSPKGAYEVLTRIGPALQLLAQANQPISIPQKMNRKVPLFGDPDLTFAAFRLLRSENSSRSTLDVFEEALTPINSISDRMALLIELGHKLSYSPRKKTKRQSEKSASTGSHN